MQQHGGYSKPLGNQKFSLKRMSSSYHMEYKTFNGSKLYPWYTHSGKTLMQ